MPFWKHVRLRWTRMEASAYRQRTTLRITWLLYWDKGAERPQIWRSIPSAHIELRISDAVWTLLDWPVFQMRKRRRGMPSGGILN